MLKKTKNGCGLYVRGMVYSGPGKPVSGCCVWRGVGGRVDRESLLVAVVVCIGEEHGARVVCGGRVDQESLLVAGGARCSRCMWWSRRPGKPVSGWKSMWWSRRPVKPVSGWKSSVLELYVVVA